MSEEEGIGKDASKCKELDTAIKEKCRWEKLVWWNKECDEIEKEICRNPSAVHSKVKELAWKTHCSSSGCLRSRTGAIIIGREEILSR